MFGKEQEKLTKKEIIDTVLDHIQSQLASSTYSAADFLKKLDHDYARTQQTEALGSEDGFEKRMGKMWVALTHEDENIGYDTSFIKEIESLSAKIKNIEEAWGKTIGQYEVEINGTKEPLKDYLKTNKRDLIIAALEKLESQQKVNPFIQLFKAIIKYMFGDNAQELQQTRDKDMMAGKAFTPLTGKDLFAQVITSDKPAETFKNVLNAQYKRLAEKGSVRQQAIHSLFGEKSRARLTDAIRTAEMREKDRASERAAAQEEMRRIEAKRSFNTRNPNLRVREPRKLTLLLDKTREEQKGEEQKGRKKPGG